MILLSFLQLGVYHCCFNCIESSEQKTKVMGDWILATTWRTSFGELSEHVQQLAKVNNMAATNRQHAVILQEVLSLSCTVANVSQQYVGRYRMEVQAASDSSFQQVLIDIGNAAESLKVEQYQNIRDACADRGCNDCGHAREWELQAESEQEGQRPSRTRLDLPSTSTARSPSSSEHVLPSAVPQLTSDDKQVEEEDDDDKAEDTTKPSLDLPSTSFGHRVQSAPYRGQLLNPSSSDEKEIVVKRPVLKI